MKAWVGTLGEILVWEGYTHPKAARRALSGWSPLQKGIQQGHNRVATAGLTGGIVAISMGMHTAGWLYPDAGF